MSRIIIVNGPPCSGKSYLVKEKMGTLDIVIDTDNLYQALTYGKPHHRPKHLFDIVDSIAQHTIKEARYSNAIATVWIITSEPRLDKVRKMAERYNAQIIYQDPGPNQCIRYLYQDSTRPDKAAWTDIINRWYSKRSKALVNSDTYNLTGGVG